MTFPYPYSSTHRLAFPIPKGAKVLYVGNSGPVKRTPGCTWFVFERESRHDSYESFGVRPTKLISQHKSKRAAMKNSTKRTTTLRIELLLND